MLTRRNTLVLLGGAAALAACGQGGGAAAPTLRIGSQKGGTKALILASAVLDGAPYQVEWSEFPAAQNLLEAVGSGAIDLGVAGDAPFQFAYQSGSAIKAVAAQRLEPPPAEALAIIVPASSRAKSIGDLRGKHIATTRGSVGHYLVLRALADLGWPVDAVKLTFLSPSDSNAALQSGAVEAWSIWVPYLSSALAGGARIILEGQKYHGGYGFDIAHESAIAAKRPLLSDFLEREAKALRWARSNVDEYARVLAKETGLPPDIARTMVLKNLRDRAPLDHKLIADQKMILETFRNAGEINTERPVDQAFINLI